MFSYRHAFHAGNHADVLKHTALIAILKHLIDKDPAIALVDTHAGAGLYRLDGEFADKSGEAANGTLRLAAHKAPADAPLAPALVDYLNLIREFNKSTEIKTYPGSPFIASHVLREHDRLKLFEMHPTDSRTLSQNIAQLDAGRRIAVFREDGFEGSKKFIPPPSRRALVLCDPSYEVKTDYARVATMITELLRKFATGTYAVWYPIIPRPEAHDLPRRLKTLAVRAGKSWVNMTLTVKSSKMTSDAAGGEKRPGLPASGMFVINPPFTLKPAMAAALPQLVEILRQDQHATSSIESGG